MTPVTRMLTVWCPDWPIVSWGVPLDEPAAVFVANRVVACSPAARGEGVAVGQRRRDAQGRCPDVAVLDRDPDREARLFEPLVIALEALTPLVEVVVPGLVAFPTRGPSRFFGGDQALTHRVHETMVPLLEGRGIVRVAVADGSFASRIATRTVEARHLPVVLPVGTAPSFLSTLPIDTLDQTELTDVLERLGLRTLGMFAALSPSDVIGRFGSAGLRAHRLASGQDEHPPDLRRPAPDLSVTWEFDPPADRIDRCAFAAKALAEELHDRLDRNGLACTRVAIEAETENGEHLLRLWRHEGALSAAGLAERVRWQLDGWLHLARLTSGVERLTLIPDEVVPAVGRQLGFWGGRAERADEVTRVVARLQGLLGPDAVMVPEWRGGRAPGEQVALIPAGAVDLGEERQATGRRWITEPWPGQIPAPSPATVFLDPSPIEVLDAVGASVGVSGRGELSAEPCQVDWPTVPRAERTTKATRSGRSVVRAWAGPWPADERWWDPLNRRRRARLQVVLDDGSAHLLMIEQGVWYLEATYD